MMNTYLLGKAYGENGNLLGHCVMIGICPAYASFASAINNFSASKFKWYHDKLFHKVDDYLFTKIKEITNYELVIDEYLELSRGTTLGSHQTWSVYECLYEDEGETEFVLSIYSVPTEILLLEGVNDLISGILKSKTYNEKIHAPIQDFIDSQIVNCLELEVEEEAFRLLSNPGKAVCLENHLNQKK